MQLMVSAFSKQHYPVNTNLRPHKHEITLHDHCSCPSAQRRRQSIILFNCLLCSFIYSLQCRVMENVQWASKGCCGTTSSHLYLITMTMSKYEMLVAYSWNTHSNKRNMLSNKVAFKVPYSWNTHSKQISVKNYNQNHIHTFLSICNYSNSSILVTSNWFFIPK